MKYHGCGEFLLDVHVMTNVEKMLKTSTPEPFAKINGK